MENKKYQTEKELEEEKKKQIKEAKFEEYKKVKEMDFHDFYVTKNDAGQVIEVTKVINGWVYNFHFPDTRLDQIVFIPEK
jgi:hypothetical protein